MMGWLVIFVLLFVGVVVGRSMAASHTGLWRVVMFAAGFAVIQTAFAMGAQRCIHLCRRASATLTRRPRS
jgi:hypothetical protein